MYLLKIAIVRHVGLDARHREHIMVLEFHRPPHSLPPIPKIPLRRRLRHDNRHPVRQHLRPITSQQLKIKNGKESPLHQQYAIVLSKFLLRIPRLIKRYQLDIVQPEDRTRLPIRQIMLDRPRKRERHTGTIRDGFVGLRRALLQDPIDPRTLAVKSIKALLVAYKKKDDQAYS